MKIQLFCCLILASVTACQDVRKLEVAVKEEDGAVIEGVETTVTFLGYSGETTQRVEGKTDNFGIFKASGSPELRMSVRLEKEGYYTSESGRLIKEKDHDHKL